MNIIEKLKTLFGQEEQKFIANYSRKFEFRIIRTRKEILQELKASKEQGKIVGIYSSTLGDGMFVTGIEDVYEWEKDTIIVFKPHDLGGFILQRNYLSLSEVKGIYAFNCTYKHPLVSNDQFEQVN
jgi:hypothetical protein